MTLGPQRHAPAPTSGTSRRRGDARRLDIQGLRAVAVGLVLLFHAGAGWLPGGFVGVDVFFVISGYLITGLLLREGQRAGRISLVGFYARRARRILPAAAVTLVASAIMVVAFLPDTRWESSGRQIVGSAFYYVNWLFAADAVDYLHANEAPSIVQHFWSLAVEEQFYIVWPLLLIAALGIARLVSSSSRRLDPRAVVTSTGVAVALITLPSLAWSIHYTDANPGAAYFVTTTRLWELGLGAAVAVFATRLQRIGRAAGLAVGVVGLCLIVVAALHLSAGSTIPGYRALLPTLGAAAVIVGGMGGRDGAGVGRLLSVGPLVRVGNLSYSLYLWHWPLLVVVTYQAGGDLSFGQGLLVVTLSFIPAWLSYRYVEQPILTAKRLDLSLTRSLQVGAVFMLVSVMAGMSILRLSQPSESGPGVAAEYSTKKSAGSTGQEQQLLGAALLAAQPAAGRPVDQVASYSPSAAEAADDNPAVYADGCHQDWVHTAALSCVYGDPTSTTVVVLAGDSHAAHWQPALAVLADDYGWRLETYTKSSCPLIDTAVPDPAAPDEPYSECQTWNRKVLAKLEAEKPDLVVTATLQYTPIVDGKRLDGHAAIAEDGAAMHRTWEQITATGVPVVAMVDTPFMGSSVPECVAAHESSLTSCDVPRSKALKDHGSPEAIGAKGLADVRILDMNRWICPEAECVPIIGQVLVYRDESHLTASYSRTLAGPLYDEIRSTGLLPSA